MNRSIAVAMSSPNPIIAKAISPNNRNTHYLTFGRFRKRNTPIDDAGGRIEQPGRTTGTPTK
jgi:hypothetical protein